MNDPGFIDPPAGTGGRLDSRAFVRRIVATVLIAGAAFLAWYLRHVIVLAFAAVVVATLLVTFSWPVRRVTSLNDRWSVALTTLVMFGLFVCGIWYAWGDMQAQAVQLARSVSAAVQGLQARTGLPITDGIEHLLGSGQGLIGQVIGNVLSASQTAVSALATLLVVVAAGIFIALRHRAYRDGLVRLFPFGARNRARSALDRTGRGLQLWLIGQLVSMSIVGVLVGVGAWLIGLPAPLALGFFAFLMEFVPFIGPVAGALPGLILAVQQEGLLGWTVLLYLAVQQLESNMITPIVERRMASVPAGVFILSAVTMGSLFGIVGLVLSGPLTVAAYVLVRAVYVEDMLGDRVEGTASEAPTGRARSPS